MAGRLNGKVALVTGASRGAFIGGFDDPTAVNLIAGSSVAGVYFDNALGGSTLANNVIGFQPDGTSMGGNAIGAFIFNSPNNSLLYNFIGHSSSNGVTISGASSVNTLVQYNKIGVSWLSNVTGNQGAGVGIVFAARDSTIGAPLDGSFGANLIAYNSGPGVWISPSGGAGNRVLANNFFNNGFLDIDLASAGPSANQPSNPATGPNRLQNHPVLTSAVRTTGANATTLVSGTLHSAPASSYRIDVYFDTGCNAVTGRGGARYPIGRDSVFTNANGDTSFAIAVPGPKIGLGVISVTATSSQGDTSETSNCVTEVNASLPDLLFANDFE